MAAVDDAGREAAIPFRVYAIETMAKTQDAAISRLRENSARSSEAISAQAVTLARHDEQLGNTHEDLAEVKTDVAMLAASVVALGEKVATSGSRVAWTLVAFAFTVAGSAIAIIATTPS